VDPRYTGAVRSYVLKLGGSTIYHRKGHSLWKETINDNMERIAKLAGFFSVAEFVKTTGYRDLQIEASLHMFATDTEDGIPRDDAIENVFILEHIIRELNIEMLKDFFARIPRRFATKEIRTLSASNELKEAVTSDIIEIIRSKFVKKCDIVEFDGQIRVDWDTGFLMYGMSNTSPKLTFMVEGASVEERNEALAYVLALHNRVKKDRNDKTPMSLLENPFFTRDLSYGLLEPDSVTDEDPRAVSFLKRFE
jgi:phosphomannomutase